MTTRKKHNSFKWLYQFAFYLATGWLLGLGFFYTSLPQSTAYQHQSQITAEGLIVLTGGQGRLEAALDILKANPGKRLLISGVNPIVEQSELSALTGSEAALFDCCVDIDRLSQNTAANAQEGMKWLRANGFNSAMIITADYHLRRSMMLFNHQAPTVKLTGYAVQTNANMSYMIREYNKYLATVAQLAIGITPTVRTAQIQRPDGHTDDTQASNQPTGKTI